MIIGMGTDFWGNAIYVAPKNMNAIDAEFIPQIYKLIPVCLSVLGASLSFYLYTFENQILYSWKVSFIGNLFYNFFSKKWFFDKVYNEYLTQSFLSFGYHIR